MKSCLSNAFFTLSLKHPVWIIYSFLWFIYAILKKDVSPYQIISSVKARTMPVLFITVALGPSLAPGPQKTFKKMSVEWMMNDWILFNFCSPDFITPFASSLWKYIKAVSKKIIIGEDYEKNRCWWNPAEMRKYTSKESTRQLAESKTKNMA